MPFFPEAERKDKVKIFHTSVGCFLPFRSVIVLWQTQGLHDAIVGLNKARDSPSHMALDFYMKWPSMRSDC